MTRNKERRYAEAVERNLWNLERKRPARVKSLTLGEVKRVLGIRDPDTKFDSRILALNVKGTA